MGMSSALQTGNKVEGGVKLSCMAVQPWGLALLVIAGRFLNAPEMKFGSPVCVVPEPTDCTKFWKLQAAPTPSGLAMTDRENPGLLDAYIFPLGASCSWQ